MSGHLPAGHRCRGPSLWCITRARSSNNQQRRDSMAQLKIPIDAQRFSKGLSWKDYMSQMGDTRARTEEYYSKSALTDDERKFFGSINQVKYAMMLAENWCGDVHRNSPLIAHVCEALQGCDLRVFFRDKETDLRDTFLNNGYQSIPVVVFFDKDWNEIGRWIERSHAATGKAAQIRAKTVDVAPKDQADAAMNEMRKQVGEAYAGGQLWRAAVQEMRLVLENRLGLAPKK